MGGALTIEPPPGLPVIDSEGTASPIFLFQTRVLIWTGDLPDEFGFDGEECSFYETREPINDDEREECEDMGWGEKYQEEVPLRDVWLGHGDDVAHETWHTERVFLTREEGTAWAAARTYRWPDGWRVYCVPAEGALAEGLKTLRTVSP